MLTGITSQDRPASRTSAMKVSSARRRPGVVPSETSAMSGIDSIRPQANLPCVRKPAASVVVPTRDRAGYLEVTLASLADQDFAEPYEVIVVDDGSRDRTPEVVARAGVRSIVQNPSQGPNAARNAAVEAAAADLIAFVDDDVFAPREWLRALVEGARRHPAASALGGPIRARLEGPAP